MADLSTSLTVTFGQPVASYNMSLSGGDESAPAVYRYRRVKDVRSEQVPGTFGLMGQTWRGKVTFVSHAAEGPKLTTALEILRHVPATP